MNLDCPSCGTTLRVPEGALGASGRRLRCAACKHVWLQTPPRGPVAPAAPSPPAPPTRADEAPSRPSPASPEPSSPEPGEVATGARPASPTPPPDPPTRADEASPRPSPAPPEPSPPAEPPAAAPPRPAAPGAGRTGGARPARAAGAGGFGVFALLLALVAAGVGAYHWRAPIACRAPWLAPAYDAAGLLGPRAAAGLEIRDVAFSLDEARVVAMGRIVNTGDVAVFPPRLRAEILDAASLPLDGWTFETPAPALCPGAAAAFEAVRRDPPSGAARVSMTFEAIR